jgi:hypothetical protein
VPAGDRIGERDVLGALAAEEIAGGEDVGARDLELGRDG